MMRAVTFIFFISIVAGGFFNLHAQDMNPGKNRVNYLSEQEKIAAFLFIPKDYKKGEKRPAIVINPPATGVKEQTAGLYAKKLSEKGFVTLAFDPRGFGESEGEPFLYNAYNITDDIRNSISYLTTLDPVDGNHIFSIGICAGSGFAGFAAAFDSRVKALAMISPFITTKNDFLDMFGRNSKLIRERIFPQVAAAANKEYATGKATYGNLVPVTEEEIKRARPITIGMRDYYLDGKPGDVPNWQNKLNTRSYYYALSFSVFDFVDYVSGLPLFMAYGDEAITAPGAKQFFELVKGEKQFIELKGADHFEMYWKPEFVNPVVDSIGNFFQKYVTK